MAGLESSIGVAAGGSAAGFKFWVREQQLSLRLVVL